MKTKTYEDFQAKWPSLFRDVYCGFSLPDGWNRMVWDMCSLLGNFIETNPGM